MPGPWSTVSSRASDPGTIRTARAQSIRSWDRGSLTGTQGLSPLEVHPSAGASSASPRVGALWARNWLDIANSRKLVVSRRKTKASGDRFVGRKRRAWSGEVRANPRPNGVKAPAEVPLIVILVDPTASSLSNEPMAQRFLVFIFPSGLNV